MAKTLTNTTEILDTLERDAAKLRRDNKGDELTQKYVDGIRFAARKLKLALRADGVVESVQKLTSGPAKKAAAPVKKTAPRRKVA